MEHELSDIYSPTSLDDRYDFIAGEGTAGVVVYGDRFAYSHHATDPAGGQLLNAFDLVRVHRFGDDDPKKSFNEMAEYAMKDPAVQAEALKRRQSQAVSDFEPSDDDYDDSWTKLLQYEKKTMTLKNNLHNIRLIMENDPLLKHIVFNQLADGMEIRGDIPWKHPGKFWRDADDSQLICYVDDKYGTFSQRNYDIAVTKSVDDRSYHPIREYFDSLPDWDGVTRAESAVINYLGAADTPYVRAATRKTLCAAYRRIKVPGIKFDYMPVLNGPQGIGKSTLIAKLGMEWYSDSLNLSDMNDKTAAEKLQGYWILEIGELAGMKKADLDKVKAFISRQDDKYRASFGRRVTPHPRQCVFFGTTNSENGYLRDITGNRRYWNIKVDGKGKYHSWDLTQDIVDQIWAEVKVLEPDEELFLPPELEDYAKGEQRDAMEADDREGLVREYLDTLLPANWDDMDIYERRDYIREKDDPTRPTGTIRRMDVSNMEIWCECFGKPQEDLKPADSYAISAIMTKIEGWSKPENRKRLPIYGRQRVYSRDE
jgi:predicted P-loop ATPase